MVKKLWAKKRVKKNFGKKKNLKKKNFLHKNFGQRKFFAKKCQSNKFLIKKIVCQKKCLFEKMLGQKKFLLKVFVKLGLTWVNGVRINLRGGGQVGLTLLLVKNFYFKKFWQGKQKNWIGLTQGRR